MGNNYNGLLFKPETTTTGLLLEPEMKTAQQNSSLEKHVLKSMDGLLISLIHNNAKRTDFFYLHVCVSIL